jgi:phospholipid transport system transporter-binding protein
MWEVSGPLDMASVPSVLAESRDIFRGDRDVRLDLAAVDRMDSAGLALIIEWMRLARRHDASLRVSNIPSQMQGIAQACGLERLFPSGSFKSA